MPARKPKIEPDALATAESDAAAEAADEVGTRAADPSLGDGGGEPRRAQLLNVTQGAIREAQADRIDVKQGGLMVARSDELTLSQGVIGLAQGQRISLTMGGLGVALADEVELHQTVARIVGARKSARLDQAAAGAVIAGSVEMGPQSGAAVIIAARVEGDVRPLFDWRAGLAFGAVFGLVVAVAGRLRGR